MVMSTNLLGILEREIYFTASCVPHHAGHVCKSVNMSVRFFGFNWYRVGVGIDYEWGCQQGLNHSISTKVDNDEINETLQALPILAVDDVKNSTTFLLEYPCEWGFHYLTSGAAVWLAFLPFYITQLLGNCWRQCCCCLCDPLVIVIFFTVFDPHHFHEIFKIQFLSKALSKNLVKLKCDALYFSPERFIKTFCALCAFAAQLQKVAFWVKSICPELMDILCRSALHVSWI